MFIKLLLFLEHSLPTLLTSTIICACSQTHHVDSRFVGKQSEIHLYAWFLCLLLVFIFKNKKCASFCWLKIIIQFPNLHFNLFNVRSVIKSQTIFYFTTSAKDCCIFAVKNYLNIWNRIILAGFETFPFTIMLADFGYIKRNQDMNNVKLTGSRIILLR